MTLWRRHEKEGKVCECQGRQTERRQVCGHERWRGLVAGLLPGSCRLPPAHQSPDLSPAMTRVFPGGEGRRFVKVCPVFAKQRGGQGVFLEAASRSPSAHPDPWPRWGLVGNQLDR